MEAIVAAGRVRSDVRQARGEGVAARMFASPSYPVVAPEEIDRFVAEQFCGKVIAVDREGFPRVSLLPFLKDGQCIEVHMVQEDPTFEALRANPCAGFLLDEPPAFTPHHLISEDDAGMATLHFRAVHFRVRAEVSTRPDEVAAALERLMVAYEPTARWTPVVDGPVYGARLRRLAVARLHVVGVEAKFKLAQNRTAAQRARLFAYLERHAPPAASSAVARIGSALPHSQGDASRAPGRSEGGGG